MQIPEYYINVNFNGNEPKKGDRVDVTLPGTVVNYSPGNGGVWVDVDPLHVEHVEHDPETGDDRVLVYRNVGHVVPGVPEMAAGQVYRKHNRTYMVHRDKPLSQGGDLVIRDSLTGMLVGEGNIIGAELVYDPKDNN